jgi:hypothetical protein
MRFAIAVVASTVLSAASGAHAQAIVLDDVDCALFDGNGALVAVPGGGHFVLTPSKNGTLEARCSGIVSPASGGGTVQYDFDSTGEECEVAACVTTKWHEVVTPNGNATVTCHCNP